MNPDAVRGVDNTTGMVGNKISPRLHEVLEKPGYQGFSG